jgi:hypothetical protein
MDREQRITQHNAIKAQLKTLTDAVNAYSATFEKNSSSDDLAAIGEISQCQVTMTESVKQMQSAIYGPLNMVMLHYEEVSLYLPATKQWRDRDLIFDGESSVSVQAQLGHSWRWVFLIPCPLMAVKCPRRNWLGFLTSTNLFSVCDR